MSEFRHALAEHEKYDSRRFDEIQAAMADFAKSQARMHQDNREDLNRVLFALEGNPLDASKPGIVQRLHLTETTVGAIHTDAMRRLGAVRKYSAMALVGVIGLAGKSLWDWASAKFGGH